MPAVVSRINWPLASTIVLPSNGYLPGCLVYFNWDDTTEARGEPREYARIQISLAVRQRTGKLIHVPDYVIIKRRTGAPREAVAMALFPDLADSPNAAFHITFAKPRGEALPSDPDGRGVAELVALGAGTPFGCGLFPLPVGGRL